MPRYAHGKRTATCEAMPLAATSATKVSHFVVFFLFFSWYALSSIIILLTKALFAGRIAGSYRFPFPLTLTTTSNIVSAFSASILIRGDALHMADAEHKYAALIGATTAAEIGLSNFALNVLTVVLSTILKGSAPLLVLSWGLTLGLYRLNVRLVLVVVTIFAGLCLAVSGQAAEQESRAALQVGVFAQFLSAILSGLRWTITQIYLEGFKVNDTLRSCCSFLFMEPLGRSLSALEVIRTTSPYTAISIAPFALLLEGRTIASWFARATLRQSVFVVSCMLLIGILVFALMWSEYRLVKATSSLTVSIGFVVKEILVIGGGMLAFGERLTLLSTFGFILVQVGVFAYAVVKRQTSFPKKLPL